MRKKAYILSLFLIVLLPLLYAQQESEIDDLKTLLTQINKEEARFDIAVQIVETYFDQESERDSLFRYLDVVLAAGNQISSDEEKAKICIDLADQSYLSRAFDYAANLASVALKLTKDPEIEFVAHLIRNVSLQPYIFYPEEATYCLFFLDSIAIYLDQISNPNLLSKYYAQKGMCAINNTQTIDGLNYLLKAEELKQEEDCELVILLTNIAAVYDELEIFDKTMELGIKAQAISQKAENKCPELVSTHAIISGAFALKKYDLVKENCQKALEFIEQNSHLDHTFISYWEK